MVKVPNRPETSCLAVLLRRVKVSWLIRTMEGKSFLSLPIFKEPACLISTSEDGKLQVEPEPMKQIKQIYAQLVVVAIAGLYRTGKSYLLNRLAGSSDGFPLGKTIESKTKGIWVMCRKHQSKEDTVMLMLDTEGLGDVAKGDSSHDNKIFTIAALLSNVLVYNMMSVFNQDAVEKLTFITEISKNIRFSNTKDDVNDEDLGLILPTFVLCLRDFSLLLEKDNHEITPDEYLDDCLQLKCGTEESVAKYNRPRECIRKYFPERRCFVFDRPGDRKTMQKLETVPFEKLSESFVEETNLFLDYMHSCGPKVLISSKPVNGGMFVTLVDNYLNAIRNGAVPDVDDAINAVANIENEKMANEAVEIFKKKIEEIQLPILLTNNFEDLNRDIQKAALAQFRIGSMFNAEKFEKQAMSKMAELWEKIKMDNRQLVRQHCESLFEALYTKHIGEKMRIGEYKAAGGYPMYKLDMDAMKRDYMINAKGIDVYEVQHVLMNFLNKEADIESNIMFEDQKMTEEDRKRELERIQTDHEKAQVVQRELFQHKLDEEKGRAEEHQKKMEEERQEYMKNQEKKLADIQSQWDKQREISETEIKMLREENEAERKKMEEKIQKMVDDHQKKEKENEKKLKQMQIDEAKKAEERIAAVETSFLKLLDEEKKKNEKMDKDLKKQAEDLQTEKKKRESMEAENKEQLKKYEEKIEEMKKQSDGRDENFKKTLEKLEADRDAYQAKAARNLALDIVGIFVPPVKIASEILKATDT